MDADGIEQLLTCPICLETLRSPKMLLCQHSLCCDCLKRYVFSSGHDQFVPCPSCRLPTPLPDPGGTTGVDALPTSFVLNSLIDAVAGRSGLAGPASSPVATVALTPGRRSASSSSVPLPAVNGSGGGDHEVSGRSDGVTCDSCRQERWHVAAIMRCVDCDEFLCDACVKMHRRNKKSQQDELVPVDEYLATAALASAAASDDAANIGSQVATVRCRRHPSVAVRSYCAACDRLVCAACAATSCRLHRHVAIAEAAERARRRLQECCERLRRRAAEQARQAATLDSAMVASAEFERSALVDLGRLRDALVAAVGAAHASAADLVRTSAEEDRNAKQSLLEEARAQRSALEGRVELLNALLLPPPLLPPSAADVDRRRRLDGDAELLARFRDAEAGASTDEAAAATFSALFRSRWQQLQPTVVTPTIARESVERELARIFTVELSRFADPSDGLGGTSDGDAAGAEPSSSEVPPAALFDEAELEAAAPSIHRPSSGAGGWGGSISGANSSSLPVFSVNSSDQMPAAAPAAVGPATSFAVDAGTMAVRPAAGAERPLSLLLSTSVGSWPLPSSSPEQPITVVSPSFSFGDDEVTWRKICDIDTGRSCVRSIAFNIDGKLLAACDDGLKVAVREGISATLLPGDSSLVAVSDGGLIVVVLRVKRELRCYYQAGGCATVPAAGSGEAGCGSQLKLLWRRSLPQPKPSGSSGGVSTVGGGALSLATQGDRVALLFDRAVMVYRLADGSPVRTLRKAVDGSQLFAGASAIALDHRGRIVMAECRSSCIRAVDDQGDTVWEHVSGAGGGGGAVGSGSPPRQAVEYNGLCVDASGDVYAADALNHRVVQLPASDRSILRTLRSSVPAHGLVHCPTHLAVYKRTVAVCHTSVHRISVFRLEDREPVSQQPAARRSNVSPECTV